MIGFGSMIARVHDNVYKYFIISMTRGLPHFLHFHSGCFCVIFHTIVFVSCILYKLFYDVGMCDYIIYDCISI